MRIVLPARQVGIEMELIAQPLAAKQLRRLRLFAGGDVARGADDTRQRRGFGDDHSVGVGEHDVVFGHGDVVERGRLERVGAACAQLERSVRAGSQRTTPGCRSPGSRRYRGARPRPQPGEPGRQRFAGDEIADASLVQATRVVDHEDVAAIGGRYGFEKHVDAAGVTGRARGAGDACAGISGRNPGGPTRTGKCKSTQASAMKGVVQSKSARSSGIISSGYYARIR